jgi:multidrug resistance protein, MATE family
VFPIVGLLEALQLVIARRVGERRREDVGALFIRGFLIAAAASVVLAVGMRLGAGQLSLWLADSDEVVRPLERYLEVAAYGIPFMALNWAYGALYVGLLRARVLLWATAVLVVTNFILSYAFILGNLGAPRLGMEGAAISFVGAEAVVFLLFTIRTMRSSELRDLHLFRLRPVRQAVLRPLARLSVPVALQGLLEEVRWFIFFLVLARVSDDLLAWSNVIFACYLVLMIPTDALSEGAYTMVSNVVGSGQADHWRSVVRRAMAISFAATAPLLIVAVAVPDAVLSVFEADAVAMEGAATALRVVAVAMLVVIPAELWMSAMLGTGDVDAAFVIELLLSAVIVMGAVAALVLDITLPQLWLALPAAALIAWTLAHVRLRTERWRGRAI